MRVLAVIPARGGSKRLPGKNIRSLDGKPLIAWSIAFAQSIPWFDRVEVSTDSADIAKCCEAAGLAVPRLRPAEFATDEASSVDVALDVLAWCERLGENFDAVALLQPTTPWRRAEHWNEALAQLEADRSLDAVVGVGPAQSHPYLTFRVSEGGGLLPWIAERPASLRAQDLEPAFVVNGALYLVRCEALQRERSFLPQQIASVQMDDPLDNLDIDTEFDWRVAESAVAGMAWTK